MGEDDLFDRLRALRQRLTPRGEKAEPDRQAVARRTLMLVDDDEDNLNVVTRRLSKDYEIVACKSGEEAVRRFVASPVRVFGVVMDIRMPGMSGLTAASLIRNGDPYVPVIFRTGFSDEYPEDEILDQYAGSVDYVTKGQRGHDFYLKRAIARGIKSYEALLDLHQANERLRQYQVRFQTVVEQLIAHERNLQTAIDFQASLLGQTGARPGISIAAAHRFCDQMGGDFYDVFDVDERRTGLLVADVSGHGIPAALVTGMLKAQMEVARQFEDPGKFIGELNANLYEMLSCGQRFITGAYAVVDCETGEVVYASAGHNPMVLVRAGGGTDEWESTGPPIGVTPDLQIENGTSGLNEGDSLWLYTDGLFESPNSGGERYGRSRLTELIESTRRDDLHDWTRSVLHECEQFVGDRQIADDMTIVSAMMTRQKESVLAPTG